MPIHSGVPRPLPGTVHKHRNLLAHAPKHMHDELTEDYRDVIYAETVEEIAIRSKVFLRPLSWFESKPLPGNEWRLKCKSSPLSSMQASPVGQWIAWKRLATRSSPSPACRKASGNPPGQPTQSNA